MNGKGSKARPLSVNKNEFNERWDDVFKKKESGRSIIREDGDSGELLGGQRKCALCTPERLCDSHWSKLDNGTWTLTRNLQRGA